MPEPIDPTRPLTPPADSDPRPTDPDTGPAGEPSDTEAEPADRRKKLKWLVSLLESIRAGGSQLIEAIKEWNQRRLEEKARKAASHPDTGQGHGPRTRRHENTPPPPDILAEDEIRCALERLTRSDIVIERTLFLDLNRQEVDKKKRQVEGEIHTRIAEHERDKAATQDPKARTNFERQIRALQDQLDELDDPYSDFYRQKVIEAVKREKITKRREIGKEMLEERVEKKGKINNSFEELSAAEKRTHLHNSLREQMKNLADQIQGLHEAIHAHGVKDDERLRIAARIKALEVKKSALEKEISGLYSAGRGKSTEDSIEEKWQAAIDHQLVEADIGRLLKIFDDKISHGRQITNLRQETSAAGPTLTYAYYEEVSLSKFLRDNPMPEADLSSARKMQEFVARANQENPPDNQIKEICLRNGRVRVIGEDRVLDADKTAKLLMIAGLSQKDIMHLSR